MKKIFSLFFAVSLMLISTSCVFAENPLAVSNNKFGIHILGEQDLVDAANLINSNGGDWGYITFVITEGERDHDRWQQVFDHMRRLHLIPIVRIATKADGDTWITPKDEEINNWVAFLNSLNWVVKNRYIIIANEPNHAKEWGGKVDPGAYASYLKKFSQALKKESSDYFILPAGLDGSSKNTKDTMEESRFINLMVKKEPDVFNYIDGWNTHAYPNPSLSFYNTELSYLENLGVKNTFPIFITETGFSNQANSEEEVAQKMVSAYENIWKDTRIVAVTPFILNYTEAPFEQYSWKKADGSFYKYYLEIQKLQKTSGNPIQIVSGQILFALAQPIMIPSGNFIGAVFAKNTGQSIWKPENISVESDYENNFAKSNNFLSTEPTHVALIIFKAISPKHTGIYSNSVYLKNKNGERVTNSFNIEAALINFDKMQVGAFFDKISSYLRNVVAQPKFQ